MASVSLHAFSMTTWTHKEKTKIELQGETNSPS